MKSAGLCLALSESQGACKTRWLSVIQEHDMLLIRLQRCTCFMTKTSRDFDINNLEAFNVTNVRDILEP